jgi:hypothetical protein
MRKGVMFEEAHDLCWMRLPRFSDGLDKQHQTDEEIYFAEVCIPPTAKICFDLKPRILEDGLRHGMDMKAEDQQNFFTFTSVYYYHLFRPFVGREGEGHCSEWW